MNSTLYSELDTNGLNVCQESFRIPRAHDGESEGELSAQLVGVCPASDPHPCIQVQMKQMMCVDNLNVPMTRYDGHWRPYTMFCSVCFIPYNYILHFENIQEEQKMIAIYLNATSILKPRYISSLICTFSFRLTRTNYIQPD